MLCVYAVVTVAALHSLTAEASVGDRSFDFKKCVSNCEYEKCRSSSEVVVNDTWLILLGWTCQENCRYECMRAVTAGDVQQGRPIRQFYGKVCAPGQPCRVMCVCVYIDYIIYGVCVCVCVCVRVCVCVCLV